MIAHCRLLLLAELIFFVSWFSSLTKISRSHCSRPDKYWGERQRSEISCLRNDSALLHSCCHSSSPLSRRLMESDTECSSPERHCALSSSRWLCDPVSRVNPGLRVLCQPVGCNHGSFIRMSPDNNRARLHRESPVFMKILACPGHGISSKINEFWMTIKSLSDYKASWLWITVCSSWLAEGPFSISG